MNDYFSDMIDDDLDAVKTTNSTHQHAKTVQHPCEHCRGTGNYQGVRIHQERSDCFACRGKGYFLTSRAERNKARAQRAARKVNKEESRIEEFGHEFPEMLEFLQGASSWSAFAGSMLGSVRKYGSLTERQFASCVKMYDSAMAREEAKAKEREAQKLDLDLSKLFDLFNTASGSGLKRPRLVIKELVISKAPDHGRNAGCLYLKWSGEYAGKITEDYQLRIIRDYNDKREAITEILTGLVDDPLGYAKLYGQETGVCCCCNRELTDPKSIELGIGPICAEKWGL